MKRKRSAVWLAALACVCATALVGNLMAGDARLPAPGLDVQDGVLVDEGMTDAPADAPRTVRLDDGYVMEGTPYTDLVMVDQSNNVRVVEARVEDTENFQAGEGSSTEPRWVHSNVGEPVPWTGAQSAGSEAQEGDRALAFDLTPGAGAPPDTLGGYLMTPFPLDDSSAVYDDVTSVPSPCATGGDIGFSVAMSHRRIGEGWASWSHGYTDDVYYSNGATSVTITLPVPACAFYFYVEPNPFEVIYFTAEGNDGTSSGSFSADGQGGAAYVGIYGEGLEWVTISTDDGVTDFAIGEFGICCFCEPVYVACCDEATGDCVDGVDLLECIEQGGRWDIDVYYCDDLDPPCGSQIGACCMGEMADPGYEPYECVGDMTNSACLAFGEETFWTEDESCDSSPPYDCGAPTYCDGSGGCDEFISNVYLPHASGTIDNSSACTGYGDYTDQVALLLISMSYDITVTNGNYWSSDVTAVWIDWNGDKDWDDDGETMMMYDPGGPVAEGTFAVPPTAIPGYTRMRIRIDYNNPEPAPCGTTTYGEVEDYTILVSGDVPFGACCDPTTGICTDDVEATDCLPPLQFAMEELCEDAFPDCGLPGACCDDLSEEGDCVDDVLQLDCFGTRHAPGVLCADLDPACGEVAFIFVTEPGVEPPPPVQCGCPMADFPLDDSSAVYDDVTSIPSPCEVGGDIGFSTPLSHRRIGSGWASWSHGYTEDVYFTNGATEVTITLPPLSRCGFYMYVEPNPFEVHTFKMIANGIIESEEFTADGQGGAAYAGVCGAGLETITIICTSGVDFAIGEFGICCLCGPTSGACCDPFTGECANEVDAMDCLPPMQWFNQEQCEELEPLCGDPGCCCFPEAGVPLEPFESLALLCGGRHLSDVLGDDCVGTAFEPECGMWTVCEHSVVLWDSYGDGWNGGLLDVYVEGELLVAGATIPSGAGPVTYTFEAGTCDTIETVYTPGGWPYENEYCIYGALGEIGCDGQGGVEPTGITVFGSCDAPTGACCLGTDGCEQTTEAGCGAGTYLGDCTSCGDGADCDGDGETDVCAIAACAEGDPDCDDCNENGIPDSCDITDGTSIDCQPNGIPDECEDDCNENGIADECDIADCGTAGTGPDPDCEDPYYWCRDCQPDGIPDVCQLGEGDSRPDANVLLYSEYVAGTDAYAATLDALGWAYTYTSDPYGLEALINGGGWTHIITNHTNTGATYSWEAALPAYLTANPDVICIVSDWRAAAGHLGPMGFTATGANNYYSLSAVGGGLFDGFPDAPLYNPGYGIFSLGTGGGLDEATQPAGSGAITRSLLNDCWFFAGPAGDAWDDLAIAGQYITAMLECGGGAGDCNDNCIPDDCDILYCDGSPWCLDCQPDGVPDGCEPDCQPNYIADECDIRDCDPDDPDCQDCNDNEIPDSCDIADCAPDDVDCQDCNDNGVPDWCDIDSEFSTDCNENGIPDDCESLDDCDGDGIPDICDPDCNENGVSDVCDMLWCGQYDPDYSCPEGNEYAWCDDCQPDGILDACQTGALGRSCDELVYDAGDCDGLNGTRPTVGWDDTGLVEAFCVPQGENAMTFSCVHVEMLDFTTTFMETMRVRIYALPTGSVPTDLPSFAGATSLFDYTYTVAAGELAITEHEDCYPGAPSWSYDTTGPSFTFDPGCYGMLVNFPGSGAVNYWASATDDGYGVAYVWGVQVDAPGAASMAVAWKLWGGAAGAGGDCNGNCIPDDCDIMDCDTWPAEDQWMCADCQEDWVPDGCQLEDNDCQPDLIPDDCQLEDNDCQENGIPDECDIANCGIERVDAVITVEIMTDDYGDETTWELVEQGGGVVASGGPYAYYDPQLYTHDVDVSSTSCYDFTIFDAWGDGICCSYGEGYYNVYYEGDLVGSGGEFGSSETVPDIGGCGGGGETCEHSITMWDSYGDGWNGCTIDVYVNGDLVLAGATIDDGDEAIVYFDAATGDEIFVDFTCGSWCSEPSYCVYDNEGAELGCAQGGYGEGDGDLTVTGHCGAGTCGPDAWCQDCQPDGIPDGCQLDPPPPPPEECLDPDVVLTIDLLTDPWGYETSWDLVEQGFGIVATGSGYASSTEYSIDVDVCSTSCYDFTIYDSFGDGIYSPGGFTIYFDGALEFDAMGGGFTGSTMTVSDIGGGCAGRDDDLLISQLPNQTNGLFSDCDYSYTNAENFLILEDVTVETLRFWGGLHAGDSTPDADAFHIWFYDDAGGMPGDMIAEYSPITADEMEQTGIILFGVHEWVMTFALSPGVDLTPGTYYVAIAQDSTYTADNWFWEVGDFDSVTGVPDMIAGAGCPPTFTGPSVYELAFELYGYTGEPEPPANDCNLNCIPDECDPDCNCDGMPDDCEDPPFIPSDPTIECPADVTVTCPDTDTGEATGLDNCGDPSLITYADEVTPATDPTAMVMYTITRTWTSTDECAELSVQCVQTITVLRQAQSLYIKGGACPAPFNRTSNGVTPMVLTGDVDFDVYDVVQDSVLIYRADGVGSGVAPSPGAPPGFEFEDIDHPYTGVGGGCACGEDHYADGIMDLKLKFRNDDMVDGLELWDQAPGEIVLLVLTGELENGCEFIAVDCIRIVPPAGGDGSLLSVGAPENPGMWIVVEPLDLTLDGEGFADFERVYAEGTLVTLTRPEALEPVTRSMGWRIDGTMHWSTERTIQVQLTEDMTVEVVYRGSSAEEFPVEPAPSDGGAPPEVTPSQDLRPLDGVEDDPSYEDDPF